jgi:hypothetical protein
LPAPRAFFKKLKNFLARRGKGGRDKKNAICDISQQHTAQLQANGEKIVLKISRAPVKYSHVVFSHTAEKLNKKRNDE